MSVTFYTDHNEYEEIFREEPCMCAQCVPVEIWAQAMDGHFTDLVRAHLADEASDTCVFCSGSGTEQRMHQARPEVNLANASARVFLTILGVKPSEDWLMGEMSFAEYRRAYMRAKNSDLTKYVVEPKVEHSRVVEYDSDTDLTSISYKPTYMEGGVSLVCIHRWLDDILYLTKGQGTKLIWS